MGLEFSHCNARWQYSGFRRFRLKLIAGIGETKWRDHPLFPFLIHSDCEGELSVEDMKKIIPAMKSIIENWKDDDYDKITAKELILGMEYAMEENKPLIFK